jgi:hypothetical protein
MKLKTLPLLIWLTLLLIPKGFAQTPQESPERSAGAYGIEPEKSYPGTVMLALMEAAEEEIGAAAEEAYAEGYKAAMARYVPDTELYKAIAVDLRTELEAERKNNRLFWPAVGVSAGLSFAVGFLCSFFIMGR